MSSRKSKKKCCIPGCLSKDTKLSKLPRIKHVFEVWQKILRAKCGLELPYGLDRRVCSLHFEAQYINKHNGQRTTFSFPTLFSPREIESGKPDEPISVDFKATNGVYYPKRFDPDEIKDGTNAKSSLEEHKLYCATHDHQYNNTNSAILTGLEIPPSPTPSAPAEDDVKSFADDEDDEDYFQAVIPEPKNFEEVTEVNADKLAKLPERLYATPGTEDDAELYLLDILDPDLLTDNIDPQNLGSRNDNLHNILSEAWPQVLAGGLASDAKQKIIDRYPRPNNCRLLQTPMMNPKMAELVPEKVVANDGKWARMQQCLGTAITAISRAMEMLLLHQSTEKALRHLTNAGLILCDLHFIHTKIRRVNVTPFVDATTKAVIKDCPTRDETLFGPDFIKKWRAAKKLEPKKRKVKKKVQKIVKKKKKQATCSGPSLVAYSGQWRAPLSLVRNRRAIKRRRPRQPEGGVKRDGTVQIQQIEQYDAIGNVIISTLPDNEESHSHIQTDTENRCNQGEVTDYVRREAVEMTDYGAGNKFIVRNQQEQIEHYDDWGHKITQSFMESKMEIGHTQVGPVVDQLNQPKNIMLPKKPVKRKKPGDGSRPIKKRNTKKIQHIEQSHMQTQRVGSSRTHPILKFPIQRPVIQAQEVQVQPTIQNYPNNRIMITRGSIPLVLPPQLPSRDMPILHSNDMPEHRSNRDPPDLIENAETNTQVRHGIVNTVSEINTDWCVSFTSI